MNEQQSPSYVEPKPLSLGFKIGIGAAMIAVPIGSALIFMQLKHAGDHRNINEEKGAAYDANSYRQIDPAAIKFQQTGQIATGLKYARAIAFDAQGHLLVAGDRKVRVLESTGELLSEITLPDYPSCITAGPQGTVLVGFRDHVEVYSAKGEHQKTWPTLGANAQLTGIAVGGQDVYIADAGRRVVVRCDLDGKILGEIGQREPGGNSGLILPSPFLNVNSTADGQLLVTNPGRHRVETYSPDGQLQGFWGEAGVGITGFIGCCNPSHLAIMADGRIVTAEKGVARIKVYLPDGRLDGVVAGPDILGAGAHGFELAVDRQNRILVLEPGAAEVRIFTANVPKTAGAL